MSLPRRNNIKTMSRPEVSDAVGHPLAVLAVVAVILYLHRKYDLLMQCKITAITVFHCRKTFF